MAESNKYPRCSGVQESPGGDNRTAYVHSIIHRLSPGQEATAQSFLAYYYGAGPDNRESAASDMLQYLIAWNLDPRGPSVTDLPRDSWYEVLKYLEPSAIWAAEMALTGCPPTIHNNQVYAHACYRIACPIIVDIFKKNHVELILQATTVCRDKLFRLHDIDLLIFSIKCRCALTKPRGYTKSFRVEFMRLAYQWRQVASVLGNVEAARKLGYGVTVFYYCGWGWDVLV